MAIRWLLRFPVPPPGQGRLSRDLTAPLGRKAQRSLGGYSAFPPGAPGSRPRVLASRARSPANVTAPDDGPRDSHKSKCAIASEYPVAYTQGMKSKLVWLLFVAAPLTSWIAAQTNPVVDAWMRAGDQASRNVFMLWQLKLQQEQLRQLELQQGQLQDIQRQRGELEKIRAEADRIRRETERLESLRKTSFSDEQMKIQQEIVEALAELKVRYPDFDTYGSRITLVADHFVLARNSPMSVKSYLEGLYILAKYADFFTPAHIGLGPPSAPPRNNSAASGSQPIEVDFSIRPEHFQKLTTRR